MAYTLKRIECWTKKRRNEKTEFTEIKIVNQMNCFPSPEASKTKQAHCNMATKKTEHEHDEEERRNATEIERCSAKNLNALTCF